VVIGQWEKIANEVEAAAKADAPSDDEDEDLLAKRMAQKLETPSDEMREKMVDFRQSFFFWLVDTNTSADAPRAVIPYRSDDDANAASRDPQVKLLFRLAKFTLMPEGPCLLSCATYAREQVV
jgi:hypothetical protein